MRFALATGLLAVLSLSTPLQAAEPVPTEPPPIRDIAPMVVHGAQPGPAMWRVTGHGHELWILGTLEPLPDGIEWRSQDVEAVIARAQEVIGEPSLALDADIGFFGSLALMPSMLRARRLPDDRRLADVLSPALYARWQAAKARHLGRDRGVEKWRPMFAAQKLYEEAIEDVGLDGGGVVGPLVREVAESHGVKFTPTTVSYMIEDPKQALREFRSARLDDAHCLDAAVAVVEHDLPTLATRANAWAVGDVATLRATPYENGFENCWSAIAAAGLESAPGLADLSDRAVRQWLDAASGALARNAVTFAAVPVDDLLAADGLLAALQARGYDVVGP